MKNVTFSTTVDTLGKARRSIYPERVNTLLRMYRSCRVTPIRLMEIEENAGAENSRKAGESYVSRCAMWEILRESAFDNREKV